MAPSFDNELGAVLSRMLDEQDAVLLGRVTFTEWMVTRRTAVVCLCLVQFVDVLGVTALTTALPAVLAGVGAPESAAGLIVTAYAMFFGGLLILGSRLGDRYGHHRVLLVGVAAFGVAGLLGATASNLIALVEARCMQGTAAAVSVPAALRLLADVTADEDARRRAVAVWSATGAAAGASGFLVGGLLTQVLDWRAVFWVNVPISVALVAAIAHLVPRGESVLRTGLDIAGAATLTVAVKGFVTEGALLERPATRFVGTALVLGGLGMLPVLTWVERRVSHPLITSRGWQQAAADRCGRSLPEHGHHHPGRHPGNVVPAAKAGATPLIAGLTLLPFSLLVIAGSVAASRAFDCWIPSAVSPPVWASSRSATSA